jgi:hypothetical protein
VKSTRIEVKKNPITIEKLKTSIGIIIERSKQEQLK